MQLGNLSLGRDSTDLLHRLQRRWSIYRRTVGVLWRALAAPGRPFRPGAGHHYAFHHLLLDRPVA